MYRNGISLQVPSILSYQLSKAYHQWEDCQTLDVVSSTSFLHSKPFCGRNPEGLCDRCAKRLSDRKQLPKAALSTSRGNARAMQTIPLIIAQDILLACFEPVGTLKSQVVCHSIIRKCQAFRRKLGMYEQPKEFPMNYAVSTSSHHLHACPNESLQPRQLDLWCIEL
jgi:hypothetical protein